MKVGILTFHRTVNYGAVLQAYALQRSLSKKRINTEIIDYRNSQIYAYCDYHIHFKKERLKTTVGKIFRYRKNRAVWEYFEEFRKKWFTMSKTCENHDELKIVEEDYAAVICGSDQVWNPKAIYKDFDAFLLKTATGKKFSYAASAGNVNLWTPHLKEYWTALHDFDGISVREAQMIQATENLSGQKVELVLDPSLLLDKTEWGKLEEALEVPQQYIFVYFLGENPVLEKCVKQLQSETKLPIVNLGRKLSIPSIRLEAGPQHFLYLIHHAAFVLTSSFHGTAFSILYEKPFLVFGNGAYNSRMQTLLSELNLNDHFMIDVKPDVKLKDYIMQTSKVDEIRLMNSREKSFEFLNRIISSIKMEKDDESDTFQ